MSGRSLHIMTIMKMKRLNEKKYKMCIKKIQSFGNFHGFLSRE